MWITEGACSMCACSMCACVSVFVWRFFWTKQGSFGKTGFRCLPRSTCQKHMSTYRWSNCWQPFARRHREPVG